MNSFRRGYNRIVYLTGIALIFITLGIEYFQYKHNQHLVLTDLKNRLDEHTFNINLRVRTVKGYVNGLKTIAESDLIYIKNFGTHSPLFSYLKEDENKKYYYLDAKDLKLDKSNFGNLIGLGSLERIYALATVPDKSVNIASPIPLDAPVINTVFPFQYSRFIKFETSSLKNIPLN